MGDRAARVEEVTDYVLTGAQALANAGAREAALHLIKKAELYIQTSLFMYELETALINVTKKAHEYAFYVEDPFLYERWQRMEEPEQGE